MNFLQFLNEVKMSSNEEVQAIAASYEVYFSIQEIELLRPLLDDVSLHWLFTGIPSSFIARVEQIIGTHQTNELLQMYEQITKK